jgi:predicted metal-binding protein
MSTLSRAEIVACETCGGKTLLDAAGRTRGEQLIAELRAAHARAVELPVEVSSVRCLWACTRSCAVAVRSPTRVGYVIASLEPTQVTATALLDYAALYAASEDGAVPYRQWPPALKGHFLCRFPKAAEFHASAVGPDDDCGDTPHPEPDELTRPQQEPTP